MAKRLRRLPRIAVPVLVALLVVVPLAWMWADSRTPGRYSVMAMGFPDYGGGRLGTRMTPGMPTVHELTGSGTSGSVRMRSVSDLTVGTDRAADVRVDLVARQQQLDIGGHPVDGYTLNGTSPGPTIRAVAGQLVEVHLENASVAAGVTLHWHGVDVPNAMDGVAGVTQDEVAVGGEFTYRFVVDRAGTYWYHSHQVSDTQVAGGLIGALVVSPGDTGTSSTTPRPAEVTAMAHLYGGIRTINGRPGDLRVDTRPGVRVRVRIVNTDNGPMQVWTDCPYRLLAIDGNEVHGPTPVVGTSLAVTAGGRVDLEVTAPSDGTAVRVQLSKGTAVVVGPATAAIPPAPPQPTVELDPLSYGTPAPLSFDPAAATRSFDYRIGRRPGFVDGRPGLFWSINGHLYPNVPMFMVTEGDIVTMHIENSSGEVHPMHLHGHRAVVLARNGVAATGSPWEFDSLNVRDGESFDIAFVADNPGLWLDHCHNLQHAAVGMIAHLAYEGVDSPFRLGADTGNDPE